MTVSVPGYTEIDWAGDGSTTAFSFQTIVPEAADLKVWLRDGDTLTLQTLGTHYSLVGLGSPSGVTINFVSAPASGKTIRARRSTVAKQVIDYGNLIKVPGDTTEAQLDRFAMALQDHQSVVGLQLDIRDLAESAAASADAAAESADEAEGYASLLGAAVALDFATVAGLLADTTMGYVGSGAFHEVVVGQIIGAQGFRYAVAASGVTDNHVVTAGGVKLYVLHTDAGEWNILAFGASTANADNFAIIQAVVDLRGTVILPDDPVGGQGSYLVSDTVLVRSYTCVRWTGATFIELSQPSTIGAVIGGYYEGPFGSPTGNSRDIIFDNPLVDGGDLGYVVNAPYGENGIGGGFMDGLQILGGVIRNCRNGETAWSGTGGKGVQIENTVSNWLVSGTLIMDCTIGIETGGAAASPTVNGHYTGISMVRCDSMMSLRHSNSPPTDGVETNSGKITDITGYNCGKTIGYWATQGVQVGAIALDRVNNFDISNITLFNDASYGEISCLVRHLKGNNNRIDVAFWGDTDNLINSEAIPPGFGGSGTRINNLYQVRHASGAADRALVTIAADGAANYYRIKTATINVELFDADSAQSDMFGYFENAAGDKFVEGPLNLISSIHSRTYPAVMSRALVGSLQFNNVGFSFGTGTQVIGSNNTDDFVLVRNSVEKLRITTNGVRMALPTFADNAAAVSGGLAAGDTYKTATGELRIRV